MIGYICNFGYTSFISLIRYNIRRTRYIISVGWIDNVHFTSCNRLIGFVIFLCIRYIHCIDYIGFIRYARYIGYFRYIVYIVYICCLLRKSVRLVGCIHYMYFVVIRYIRCTLYIVGLIRHFSCIRCIGFIGYIGCIRCSE